MQWNDGGVETQASGDNLINHGDPDTPPCVGWDRYPERSTIFGASTWYYVADGFRRLVI